MSKLAQSVQQAVDAMAEGNSGNSVTTDGSIDMATKKRATKAAPRVRKAAKPKAEKKVREKKVRVKAATSGRVRIQADAVFVFEKRPAGIDEQVPYRGIAILNAIEKVGEGSAEQVAKRVVKSDYDGKQELVYLSGYFLRKLVKLGAVSVKAA